MGRKDEYNSAMSSNMDANNNKKQNYCDFSENLAFALTSPAGLAAVCWLIVSFLSVLYGSSIIACLSFCFPLIMVPYIINQQMRIQLLPSLRKRASKLRVEANALAMENVQLRNAMSRMQRQIYRLSVVEERFEYLCKLGDKDITKMKHLAKKKANTQQKMKVNSAANEIKTLMTSMLRRDDNGNCLIRECDIDEVVSNIEIFAGRNFLKIASDEIRKGFISSMTKINKATLIRTNNSDVGSSSKGGKEHRNDETKQEKIVTEKIQKTTREINPNTALKEHSKSLPTTEETWSISNNSNPVYKLPSNKLLFETRKNNNTIHGIQANSSSGTADSPIDIDKLLFNDLYSDQVKTE